MSLNPQSSYPIPESTQRDCRKIEILKDAPGQAVGFSPWTGAEWDDRLKIGL